MTEVSVWTQQAAHPEKYDTESEIRGLQSDNLTALWCRASRTKTHWQLQASKEKHNSFLFLRVWALKLPPAATMWNLICYKVEYGFESRTGSKRMEEKLSERHGKNKGGELIKEKVAGETGKRRNWVRRHFFFCLYECMCAWTCFSNF